jgi:hypothetical protein
MAGGRRGGREDDEGLLNDVASLNLVLNSQLAKTNVGRIPGLLRYRRACVSERSALAFVGAPGARRDAASAAPLFFERGAHPAGAATPGCLGVQLSKQTMATPLAPSDALLRAGMRARVVDDKENALPPPAALLAAVTPAHGSVAAARHSQTAAGCDSAVRGRAPPAEARARAPLTRTPAAPSLCAWAPPRLAAHAAPCVRWRARESPR